MGWPRRPHRDAPCGCSLKAHGRTTRRYFISRVGLEVGRYCRSRRITAWRTRRTIKAARSAAPLGAQGKGQSTSIFATQPGRRDDSRQRSDAPLRSPGFARGHHHSFSGIRRAELWRVIPQGNPRTGSDANDYFGKGLSGGKVVLYPPEIRPSRPRKISSSATSPLRATTARPTSRAWRESGFACAIAACAP